MSVAPRTYRANPVEIVIFLGITAVFGHSLYTLLYDRSFSVAQTTPSQETRRMPAALTAAPLGKLEVQCSHESDDLEEGEKPAAQKLETASQKVRLLGPLCGGDLKEVKVANQSQPFQSAVFLDTQTKRFSTEYIPLAPGKNTVQVEYASTSGESHLELLEITRK